MAENSRYFLGGLFVLFLAFSAREMFSDNEGPFVKEIPKTSFKHTFAGPTLKVLYCISWGYRKAFEQYASIIQDKYPEITVLGDTFPPPSFRMYLASIVGIVKWCLIAMVLANFNPFIAVGINTPNFFLWMIENRMFACLMTFFLSNTIEGQLISTGAFEVIFNDVPVWSKIQTGRFPSPPELFQIIENHKLIRSTSSLDL